MDRNRLSVSSDSLFKELAFTPAKLLMLTLKLFTVNTLINSIALFFRYLVYNDLNRLKEDS